MAFNPQNPNGSATSANSAPVVIASDQAAIPVTESNTPLTAFSGTVTTATSTITSSGTSVSQAGSVTVYISGTYVGVNVTFEQSPDGTTWYATQGQRADTGALTTSGATGVLTSSSTVAYDITPLLGSVQFRVRATAWTSGTANVIIAPAIRAVEISPTLATGTNTIGAVNIASAQTLATVTTVGTVTTITNGVKSATNTTGGATTFTLISAATTNATLVKSSAGTLYGIYAYNNGASAAYLKIFNLATAPTVGTSTAVLTILLPAGGGSNIPIPPQGLAFGTGISIAITGVGTTADTTAVAAAQVFVNGAFA